MQHSLWSCNACVGKCEGLKSLPCFILGYSQIFNMWNTSKSGECRDKASVGIICGNCSFCMEEYQKYINVTLCLYSVELKEVGKVEIFFQYSAS